MAQVLKDEIRNKILVSALDEFYQGGYQLAAMRAIAAKAQIPTGLIYSYYKNKEALFQAVLRPVRYDWARVLNAGGESGHQSDAEIYGLSRAEADCLCNLFDHRREFIILMDKSEGTSCASEKERLVKAIEAHLLQHREDPAADAVFVHIIASNFVDGLMQIMYHYQGKEWAMMLLHKLSKMYLSGIGL